MNSVNFSPKLLHPKLWPSWLAMGLWWLMVQACPFRLQLLIGAQLGNLLYRRNIGRVRVARRNLELCFPDSSASEREELLRKILQSTCIGIFESGAAWFWHRARLRRKFTVEGIEHIEAARQNGKGVLFMGIHFTAIEIGAACVNQEFAINGFYRPHTNAVYEFVQAYGRIRHNPLSKVIPNNDVRAIVKSLRSGEIVNYAPDQDYGRDRSVFAPFFHVNAATVKAPAHLAKAGRAEIIPWVTTRNKDGHYVIRIYPPLTSRLSEDDHENAVVINRFIEERVRENPEQYLWVHRRFKTRPLESDPSLYKQ